MTFKKLEKFFSIIFIIFGLIYFIYPVFAEMSIYDLPEEQQKVAKEFQEEYNNNQILRQNFDSQEEYSIAWELDKKNCFDKLTMIANHALISVPNFNEFIKIYEPYLDFCDYGTFYNTLCLEDPSKLSEMNLCANPSCEIIDGKEKCVCLEAKTCGELMLENINLTNECETKKSEEIKICTDKISKENIEEKVINEINKIYFQIEDGIRVVDVYNGHECLIEGVVESNFLSCVDDLLDVSLNQIVLAKFSNNNAKIEDFFQDHDLIKECTPKFDSDELYESKLGAFLAICNNSDYARSRAYSCINDNWDEVYSKKDPSKAKKNQNNIDEEKIIEENKDKLEKHYENLEKEKEKTINELASDLEKNLLEIFAGNEELIKTLTEELNKMEDPYDKIQRLREEKKNLTQDSKIQKLKEIYLELGGKNEDLDLILNSGTSVEEIKMNLGKAISQKGTDNSIIADSGVLEDIKSSLGDGIGVSAFAASNLKSGSEAIGNVVYSVKPSKELSKFYKSIDQTNKAYGWVSDAYDNIKFMEKVENLDIDPNTKEAVKALRVMGSITKNVANYLPPGLSDGVGALGSS
ncbi:MAG: hypothetical protein PHR26_03435, partial [Candidatus ainarchaeum sp.]|nr:hypothetical protein [Candidatus ainarchaeum sp.]